MLSYLSSDKQEQALRLAKKIQEFTATSSKYKEDAVTTGNSELLKKAAIIDKNVRGLKASFQSITKIPYDQLASSVQAQGGDSSMYLKVAGAALLGLGILYFVKKGR